MEQAMRVMTAVLGAALVAACASQPVRQEALAPRAGPAGAGSVAPSVGLAGTWQLDLRASGRFMSPRGGPGGGAGAGGFGGRQGGYPQGATGGGAGRDSLQARDSLARDSLRAEFGRLVIEQADSALTFTQGRQAPLLVYGDWRETRIHGRHGAWDVTFVTGRWAGSRFDVRRVLPSRTVVVETYEVSRDGRTLTVTTRIAERSDERGEILPREGRRVYNRVVAAQ
jgi:hypothetical protein